ncbi:ATP-binding cassette domain-containing protein [Microbacterium sp. 179-I 3D3 NHS]|uniref:ATP-binding cassette domain-containing protein n=1 Tax=unclassified Microbacterium TaxID=2609290 RepID=UPI0039A08731
MAEPLIEAVDLVKDFRGRAGVVRAVDGVSFTIERGSTLGLVGESGSGKSSIARLVMGLQEPTEGLVRFAGEDIAHLRGAHRTAVRRNMQMVFQNPYGSLLPHYSVVGNVTEPLRIARSGTKSSRRAEGIRLLERVGLTSAHADLYPRQLSGGQQQRVAIARALALSPEFLVCDEPTSSLDVSIQAQILELFQELQDDLGLTCLFISHNLAVVERVADDVAVIHNGRIVEIGPAEELFARPRHPYTRELLAAVLPVRKESARASA